MSKNSKGFLTILLAFIGYMLVGLLKSYSNELLNFSTFINDTLVPSLFFIVFFAVGYFIIKIWWLICSTIPASAEDIAIPDSLIIYLDETESEVATDVHVVEDKNDSLKINSSDTLLRVSPIFSAVI